MSLFMMDEGFTDDEDQFHAHEPVDATGVAQDSTLDILNNLQLHDREGVLCILLYKAFIHLLSLNPRPRLQVVGVNATISYCKDTSTHSSVFTFRYC